MAKETKSKTTKKDYFVLAMYIAVVVLAAVVTVFLTCLAKPWCPGYCLP